MNKLKITLVDDDTIFCFLFKKLLDQYNKEPIELKVFSDGHNAAENFRINKDNPETYPHLLFIDINMPLMTGWELIETINQEGLLKNGEVNMFVISSSISQTDLELSKKTNLPINYLTKPITHNTLFNEIEKYWMNFKNSSH